MGLLPCLAFLNYPRDGLHQWFIPFLFLTFIPLYERTAVCLSARVAAYLGCFHVRAVIDEAAVNIFVHIFL